MIKKALALLLLSASLRAAPFDKGGLLGVGASEAAQGGAVVARIDDGEALWWNPAGLDKRRDFDLGVNYGQVLGGSSFDTAVDHRGWIAALALGYGIGYRHVGFQAGADEQEISLGVAFPFTQDERLLMGFALRSLQERLGVADVHAGGYGLDLGFSYKPALAGDPLTIGLALRDAQADLEWSTGVSSANPVQLVQLGAAWSFDPDTSVEADTELASDPATGSPSGEGFKLGAERWWGLPHYGFKHLMALRLGYLQSSALAGTALGGQFSAGLGFDIEGFHVDYAAVQDVSGLGTTQRLSGSYRFGSGQPASPTAKPRPSGAAAPVKPWTLGLSASPALFNPLTHAARLTLSVSISASGSLSQVAETRVELLPSTGAAVFSLTKPGQASDTQWAQWDGRQDSGAWALPGRYKAVVSILDAKGVTLVSAATSFQLDLGRSTLRLVPDEDVFAPIAQSTRPNAVVAVGYQGADPRRWTLTIVRQGANRPVRVLSGRKLPGRLTWDGRDRQNRKVPDGSYDLDMSLLTESGVTLTAKTSLDVDTRRPSLDLVAKPRVFEPKVDVGSVSFTLGAAGESGIPSRWSLSIETLQGKKLKSFNGKGGPPQQIVWNGVDEAGQAVASGALYYANFDVEMESGAVARQPRLALASKVDEPKQPFRVPLQTVRFQEGEESPQLDDFRALKEAAAAVKKYSTDYVVLISGYAGSGESGSAGGLGELELSFLRAKTVRDFLVESEGLSPDKVKAVGRGADESAAAAILGSDARAKARRVDVILYAQ
jgi:outer membrane protein OmpA-like peptidoglycan-associated protein